MYKIFDITLNSDIPLPELPEAKTANSTINIQAGVDTNTIPENPQWIQQWKTLSDKISISCAKLDNSYLLRFPDLIDFIISFSGNSVYYFPKKSLQEVTIRHLLIDQVIPRIIGQSGRLVLHASAIRLQDGTGVAFLGNSGWGKSTIASSLLERDAILLTDDCLLVEVVQGKTFIIPNYYGVRLFKDSAKAIFTKQKETADLAEYSLKKRLIIQKDKISDIHERNSLNTIFLLNDPNTTTKCEKILIDPINGVLELISLLEASFILDPEDKKLISTQFMQVGKIIKSINNFCTLKYPRNYAKLPIVLDEIIRQAR